MLGTLYIVATPIGNLEDITLRAIRILTEVDIILAEDTRVTRKLLTFVNSNFSDFVKASTDRQLISYHQHSDERKKYEILKYLIDGKNIALVTDAGTPGLSDPGNELIDFLYKNTSTPEESPLTVVPIPGPSAHTSALSVSGMPASHFVFAGFLPKKGLNKFVDRFFSLGETVVYFDSPHRVVKNLVFIKNKFGESQVFVAREITKLHESFYKGRIDEVIKMLEDTKIRGEVTVVIRPAP
jgi:16S rRNA (cytidine1402-2'-O)-methyltransferase